MTNLTDSNVIDLKEELDTSEIWNDVRVMLPSYTYTLELREGAWYKLPQDLIARQLHSISVAKYGRRTRTQNKHVIDETFAQSYCNNAVEKYHEPSTKMDVKMLGLSDADVVTCLTAKIADQFGVIDGTSGLNTTGIVERLTLDIDLDLIPRLTLNITEARELDLLDWFRVDVDVLDGPATIALG